MKEEEILSELFIDSLNLSRNLIRESTKLKLNKSTVYQTCINDYSMKQYKLFRYVKNMKCSTLDDLKLRRYILNIARSYLKVLYTKYLDMIELLYNRRYDEFESTSKKNNYKKRFSKGKFNLIKNRKLISKSFEIKKNILVKHFTSLISTPFCADFLWRFPHCVKYNILIIEIINTKSR